MIASPIILFPMTDWESNLTKEYKSYNTLQQISGLVPISGDSVNNLILVKYRYRIERDGFLPSWSALSAVGVTVGSVNESTTEVAWFFSTEGVITLKVGDTLHLEFVAEERSNVALEVGYLIDQTDPSSISSVIVSEEQIIASLQLPTGIRLKQSREIIKILVPSAALLANENTKPSGVNFYVSSDPGGGEKGYQIMNNFLIVDVDDTETTSRLKEETLSESQAENQIIETIRRIQTREEFYTFTLNKNVLTELINEGKIENVFLNDNQTIDEDARLYFTTTISGYNNVLAQSVESYFSVELEGKFLSFYQEATSLPERNRNDILFSLSNRLLANSDLVSIFGGTVIRDFMDPISEEFEKYYVIQDFVFTCLSVDTLLAYDDADGDGISDSIETNFKKSRLADALGITENAQLQTLIDDQFDRLASNHDITRQGAAKATTTVIFSTDLKPANDVLIPDSSIVFSPGDVGQQIPQADFKIIGTKIMDIDNINYYYNETRKRYELQASVEAVSAGASSNVPAGSITEVTGLDPTLSVENFAPAIGGSNRESNRELADRIKLAIASFDSGTEGGYATSAQDVPGVTDVRVEEPGDPLMVRDFDEKQGKGIGGKVDVYIKGRRLANFIDQVAFKFEHPTDVFGKQTGEQFFVVNASEFRVKTNNPRVGVSTPIVAVSNVRNVTRGKDYSLEDMSIVGDGDTVLLSPNSTNIAIGMATLDVIEVAYTYRSSNVLQLVNQPVKSISSVSTIEGTLIDSSKYRLVKLEDPLINGGSTISRYGVEFLFESADEINEFRNITDEQHDMLINIPAKLDFKGVDEGSVVVVNADDNSIEYKKDVDYSVLLGDQLSFTFLELLPNSMIRHGDRVSVSYRASENFNVTYTTNTIIKSVQDNLDIMKHSCADSIAKEAIGNKIDLSMIVVRKGSSNFSSQDENRSNVILKSRVQTVVADYVSRLKMGDTLTQSALVSTIRSVPGVQDVKVPLTKMMKRNGSFIPLEGIGTQPFEVYQKTSSRGVTSYRTLNVVLSYPTTENGGDENLFRAIYEDNRALLLVNDPTEVAKGPGRGYIQTDGKIIVSTKDGAPPQSKNYKVAYYVLAPASFTVSEDIETDQIEYLEVDSISLKDIEIVNERVVKRGL